MVQSVGGARHGKIGLRELARKKEAQKTGKTRGGKTGQVWKEKNGILTSMVGSSNR
jgi:hypothetical protein